MSFPVAPDARSTAAATPGTAVAAARQARAETLARDFVREPELILACLEQVGGEEATATFVYEAAQAALAAQPTYADLHYYASQAAMRAGALKEAERLIEAATQLNPRYKDAYVLAAKIALQQGQSDRALALGESVLFSGGDYPDVHVLLGDAWRAKGRVRQARAAYERALQLNPALAAARAGLESLLASLPEGRSNVVPS